MELKLSLNKTTIPLFNCHHRRLCNSRCNSRFYSRRNSHRKLTCQFSHSLSSELQSKTIKTLEWNRPCTHLPPFTSTYMAHSAAQYGSIPMGRTLDETRRLLDQTTAALGLLCQLEFSGLEDVPGIVDSASSGELLSTGELCAVKRTLRSARRLLEQLERFSDGDGEIFEYRKKSNKIRSKCRK